MRMLAVAGLLLWLVNSAWHCGFGTDEAGLSPAASGLASDQREHGPNAGSWREARVKSGLRIDGNGVNSNQAGGGNSDVGPTIDPNG